MTADLHVAPAHLLVIELQLMLVVLSTIAHTILVQLSTEHMRQPCISLMQQGCCSRHLLRHTVCAC